MTIGQLKDLMQEMLGHVELSLEMTNFLLASGRREVEKRVNAYWMTRTTLFSLTQGVDTYDITSTSGIIARPNFKEIYFLSTRELATDKWSPVKVRGFEVLSNTYSPVATASLPQEAAVDNVTLTIFPKPTKAFLMRLHAWEWQTNPTDNTLAGDDLMTRFPEALLYASAMVGTLFLTKNMETAKPWADLLVGQIPVIQAYSDNRIKRTSSPAFSEGQQQQPQR